MAGAPRQQELGCWSQGTPSQEAQRGELLVLILSVQPGPHDGGSDHIQGESIRDAPQMWPEVCLLRLRLNPVK